MRDFVSGQSLRKIGFFGGSFDPIHFGHLNLAIQIAEKHKLDQVLFCPAHFSPHKNEEQPMASNNHRKEMVLQAIAPIKSFSLLDYELNRPGPSFTIDTIRMLSQAEPGNQFFLILGEDALSSLYLWKDVENLLQLAHPLIGSRLRNLEPVEGLSNGSRQRIEKGMTPISLMEISSTTIRERLRQKKYCGHLVPHNVLNYILKYELY